MRKRPTQPTTEQIIAAAPEVIIPAEYTMKGQGKPGKPKKLMGRKSDTPGSWFTEEKRIEAVTAYAIYGNIPRVSEITKVAQHTLRAWRRQEWWNELIQRVRIEKDEELDSKFSAIIEKTLDKVIESVEEGNSVYDLKRGQLVKVPISAKEGAEVINKIVDKRQLLRGLPTRRTENTSKDVQERLKMLAKEFEKIVKGRTPITIEEGEITDVVEV